MSDFENKIEGEKRENIIQFPGSKDNKSILIETHVRKGTENALSNNFLVGVNNENALGTRKVTKIHSNKNLLGDFQKFLEGRAGGGNIFLVLDTLKPKIHNLDFHEFKKLVNLLIDSQKINNKRLMSWMTNDYIIEKYKKVDVSEVISLIQNLNLRDRPNSQKVSVGNIIMWLENTQLYTKFNKKDIKELKEIFGINTEWYLFFKGKMSKKIDNLFKNDDSLIFSKA